MNDNRSPISPSEKDINHILPNEKPVVSTSSLSMYIQLVEPVLFLRGFEVRNRCDDEDDDNNKPPPCILRGTVIVRLLKPTKFKKISLLFKGVSRIDWPEGISTLIDQKNAKIEMNLNDEFNETKTVIENNWPFYNYKSSGIIKKLDLEKHDDLKIKITKLSGASLYRTLTEEKLNDDSNGNLSDISPTTSLNISLTDHMELPAAPALNKPSGRRGSFFTDLLSSTFSRSEQEAIDNEQSTSDITDQKLFDKDTFVFPPGEYVYPFEQLISHSLTESIKADYGQVKYELLLEVKRFSMFKSNFLLSKTIQLIRSPSDSSIEESEPIIICKNWKEQLNYDILINSKNVILDAFLPISIHLTALDKICLYRIRIYITESMEYFGSNKTIHRFEKNKKFLLAEHNGPLLDKNNTKIDKKNFRNYGNLLEDQLNGDLIDKVFEYQIFVPRIFNGYKQLHPDTTNEDIIVNHWLKISFRTSFMVDGKLKFFEISIDSPIRVLNKLCSHANTLLPNYYSNYYSNRMTNETKTEPGLSVYHNSNIFFPKEVCSSNILTDDAGVFDLTIPSILQPTSNKHNGGNNKKRLSISIGSLASSNTVDVDRQEDDNTRRHSFALVDSPKLKSNIYQPMSLPKELAYPQAIPLFRSTVISPSRMDTPPPPYEKRHHSNLSNLNESQETLIGNNLDLNISQRNSFRNSSHFKRPIRTVEVPVTSSTSSPTDFNSHFTTGITNIHRRNSLIPDPKTTGDTSHPRSINEILSEETPHSKDIRLPADDENDITMFNMDLNSWYPTPLK